MEADPKFHLPEGIQHHWQLTPRTWFENYLFSADPDSPIMLFPGRSRYCLLAACPLTFLLMSVAHY